MKIFIYSVSVFCVLCIAVTLNAITVCNRADELIQYTESLPAEPMTAQTDRLLVLWSENKAIFGLTVSHGDMDKIETSINDLCHAADTDTFEGARSTLLILLRDLRDFSSVSFERII